MADEARMGGGVPEGVPGRMQGVGRVVQGLGVGERLAVLGAAGVLVVWFVFGLLTRDYGVGQVPFILAVGLLFLAYRHHMQKAPDWSMSYATLVIVLAGLLGVIGVRELLLDLRYEIYDAGTGPMLGAVLFWVTAIAAGVGAFQMATMRR